MTHLTRNGNHEVNCETVGVLGGSKTNHIDNHQLLAIAEPMLLVVRAYHCLLSYVHIEPPRQCTFTSLGKNLILTRTHIDLTLHCLDRNDVIEYSPVQ